MGQSLTSGGVYLLGMDLSVLWLRYLSSFLAGLVVRLYKSHLMLDMNSHIVNAPTVEMKELTS